MHFLNKDREGVDKFRLRLNLEFLEHMIIKDSSESIPEFHQELIRHSFNKLSQHLKCSIL